MATIPLCRVLITACLALRLGAGEAPAAAVPHVLLPGFTIRELPLHLTSLNNVEYAPDGRLFAGGYDGRFHLLRDSDGDGLEDQVTTFQPTPSPDYPLGMLVHDGAVYAVLSDAVVRFRDGDGDGVPETRETVVQGFDDPELAKAPYLNHRRVDSSMAIAIGADEALYVTMGNAGYNNPYWKDKGGVHHYATDRRRGCLLRLAKDGTVTQLASGLRYIMSLQFNRAGDLFGTDQEGATWVPNGNPFDELLHIEPGRHYGFPPRHPQWLPAVVDEPSVYDYAPQHQSTCGFRFNGPLPGRGRFGPEAWADDAIVVGASRGKVWRTALVKTAAGYVARTQVIADLGLLAIDCAISPAGDLVVCCHTGAPDWGNGPKGPGRVFKLGWDQRTPQPALAWAAGPTRTTIAFDRALPAGWDAGLPSRTGITGGAAVDAGDRVESIRPGYAVVKAQQAEPRQALAVSAAQAGADGREVVLEHAARTVAQHYAVSIAGATPAAPVLDLAHDLGGVAASWRGEDGGSWDGWLPHADPLVARAFTRGSASHAALWAHLATPGTLTLRGQLDLERMLIPATQPGSQLDYTPEPEVVTLRLHADSTLAFAATGMAVIADDAHTLRAVTNAQAGWRPFTLTLGTPLRGVELSWSTDRDPRPRALALRRFLLPFATPPAAVATSTVIPEIAGGDWQAGRELFSGKALCASCHQLRGQGAKVGPELGNLVHRDYASVLKDISDPNATINPDAIAYQVTCADGTVVVGTRLAETADELQIAQPGGAVATLKKAAIAKAEPLTVSLMPPGLERALSAAELRDLMTYLLMEAPAKE